MSAENDDWLSFAGFRQLAKWLLDTKAGQRFTHWFLRKYYRELLATESGAAFCEWVTKKLAGEMQGQLPKVVVELNPDGFVRVYGAACTVSIVQRLVANSAEAEALTEEIAWLSVPKHSQSVYLNERNLLATANWKNQTAMERIEADAHKALHARIRDIIGRQKQYGKSVA